jgi:hypothetical protein
VCLHGQAVDAPLCPICLRERRVSLDHVLKCFIFKRNVILTGGEQKIAMGVGSSEYRATGERLCGPVTRALMQLRETLGTYALRSQVQRSAIVYSGTYDEGLNSEVRSDTHVVAKMDVEKRQRGHAPSQASWESPTVLSVPTPSNNMNPASWLGRIFDSAYADAEDSRVTTDDATSHKLHRVRRARGF